MKLMLQGLALVVLLFGAARSDDTTSHRILIKVDSKNITQSDLDDMGEVMFRLFYPDRKINEITPRELEMLNPVALKELVIIFLTESETEALNSDKDGRNNINVSAAEVARFLRNTQLDALPQNRLARRYARTQLETNQIIRAFLAEPTPSPRKVRDFYKKHQGDVFTTARQVKVRHIFFNGADDESVSRKAMRIFDDLKKVAEPNRSEEFAKAARNFSEDRFKAGGGLLVFGDREGWFQQDHNFTMPDGSTLFPRPMLDGILALRSPGDIELRKSEKGWHLLYLEDIRGGMSLPYEKVRRLIEDYLGQEAVENGKISWLREKVSRTLITWNDGSKFPVDKILVGAPEEQRLKMFKQHVVRVAGK